jgi:hypothetical protein
MRKFKLLIIIVLIANSGYSQIQVSGQVIDLFNRKPIKGAKVIVVDSRFESKTDSLGQFSLPANVSDSLIVEHTGYYSKKVQITRADNLVVQLEDSFPIFLIVDEPAQFPGGLTKFYGYVKANLKHPTKKQKHGRIMVRFAIDTTGLIMPDETKVLKAYNENLAEGIHETYDPEIIRLVNASPAWITARQRGKKVRQEMRLPISF